MEYVQQVSLQIAAASLGDAKALTDELERHRGFLRSQRGYRGMQINRSDEPDGNALLTIETRWRDDAALNAYTEQSNNVYGIVNKHAAIAVPGSTQVRRMEAVGPEPETGSPVYERLMWAFLMPVAAVTFGLAIIFGLSRVYLASSNHFATALAATIALGILVVAWYFASNVVPRWQYAAVGAGVAALLIAGGIWGQTSYNPPSGEAHGESPTPGGGNQTPVAPGQVSLQAHDNYFTLAGSEEKNPTITVATGATIPISNQGKAIHNLHIAPSDANFSAAFCKVGGDAPCSDPASIRAGTDGKIVVSLAPGSYTYRCDFHTAEMEGTITVTEAGAAPPPGGGAPPPPAGGGETPAAGGGGQTIDTNDNFFTLDGSDEKNPAITVTSGATLTISNKGKAIHNMHVATTDATFEAAFCKVADAAPCSEPASVRAGTDGKITVDLPPGEYTYRCDFHTAEMEGKITVQ